MAFIFSFPPFYPAVLDAWRALDGPLSADLSHLFIGDPSAPAPVSNITCKSCYDLVLGANSRSPHCELKFRPSFGTLYWPATMKQVHIMSLDRPVKTSVGVSAMVSIGLDTTWFRTASVVIQRLYHLFFCPLAQSGISWVQSLLFRAAPLAPTLTIRHLLFGFSNDELLVVLSVFVYLINVLKSSFSCCVVFRRNVTPFQLNAGAVVFVLFCSSWLVCLCGSGSRYLIHRESVDWRARPITQIRTDEAQNAEQFCLELYIYISFFSRYMCAVR